MASQATGRRYHRITQEEFEEFLLDFTAARRVDVPGTSELVYAIDLPRDELELRIYSTLEAGTARNCGDDAIRTVIWDLEHDEPIGGRTKTLRIESWRGNLAPKIRDLMSNWRDEIHGYCDECGRPMNLREPGRDDDWDAFLGCSGYPECKNTEELDE